MVAVAAVTQQRGKIKAMTEPNKGMDKRNEAEEKTGEASAEESERAMTAGSGEGRQAKLTAEKGEA